MDDAMALLFIAAIVAFTLVVGAAESHDANILASAFLVDE